MVFVVLGIVKPNTIQYNEKATRRLLDTGTIRQRP
jgi:hypothetical protein